MGKTVNDIHVRDTRANQPAASTSNKGFIYCVTDEDNILERSNGSTWQSYSPSGLPPTGSAGGDLTGTYPNPTIANDAVTYAKMQNVSATDKVLGRSSSGSGNVEEITCTSFARSILDDADAAAVRSTLGVGTGSGGTGYTPSLLGLPPALGGWTQVNYGSSTSDNNNGFIYLEAQDPGVNDTNNIRILTYPLPGSTFDLMTTIRPIWLDHRSHAYESSIGIRESSSGKLVLFTFLVSAGTFYVQINRYTNPTTFSANLFSQSTALLWGNGNFGFRIKQASGTRNYWWSNDDGGHWMAIGQETSTDFLTPDQAVLAANSQVNGAVVGVLLNGWSLT